MKKITIAILLFLTPCAAFSQLEGTKGAYSYFGAMTGPTILTNAGRIGGSLRLFYEFRNSPEIGYSFSLQGTYSENFEYMIGAQIFYYPYKRLKFWGSSGVAFIYTVPYSLEVPPKILEKLEEQNLREITGNFYAGLGGGWELDLYTYKPRITMTPFFDMQLMNFEHAYITFGVSFELEFLYLSE